MISYKTLKKQTVNFERLTGGKLSSFKEIVEKSVPVGRRFKNPKKVSGRRSHLKTLEDENCRFYIPHVFCNSLISTIRTFAGI
jgi:hypothetical protein